MSMTVKTESGIADMRIAGKMLAQLLALMREQAVPGISPKELANIAREELKKLGEQITSSLEQTGELAKHTKDKNKDNIQKNLTDK